MTPPTTPNRPSAAIPFSALGRIAPHLWPVGEPMLRLRVVAALLLLAAAKAANVLVPIAYARAVDALAPQSGAGAVIAVPIALLVGYGLLRVMSSALGELRNAVFSKVQARAGRRVALDVFRHLHALSMRFHMDRATGGLSRVIERGVRGIATSLNFLLFNIIPTIVEILFVSVILWWMFAASFALTMLGTIIAYVAFTLIFTNWRLRFRRQMNQTDEEANTKAVDSLLNYETVKYFGNEAHESRRYDESMTRYESAYVKSETTLNMLNAGQATIMAVGLTITMLLAGRGIADGSMSIGDLVMVNTYLIQLYQPLNILGFAYREIKQGLTDMEQMFALLDVPAEVRDAPNAAPLALGPGEIRFEDVRFGYDPDRQILNGVSFTIEPGHTLAVVGPSGAGKSTIARLLYRFYDITGGRITIDGQDLRDVTQSSLRSVIGIVPQDTVLFNDSIGYNIGYGREGSNQIEIEEAARGASIHGFIESLPEQYAAKVGERGLKLSGGEKQRVAIARTLLKNPPILILDEATSALDSRTESEIQATLERISERRTTIIIAHRLSTIVDADQIMVLDVGRVAEQGTHNELLRKGGLYAEMWARQQSEAEDEAVPSA